MAMVSPGLDHPPPRRGEGDLERDMGSWPVSEGVSEGGEAMEGRGVDLGEREEVVANGVA